MDGTPEPGELRLPLALYRDSETGEMVIPADDVCSLLRASAQQWLAWEREGQAELDPQTVALLSGALVGLTDQIDIACISAAS
ncbi:hypothetical protein Kpho02_60130 [Kitasatospora phosalacinea]|uniref:Uncharacterized protein n=1 Tax=Kitasatospora phosalacinea TaxID=2065 RepID=A0A9W6V625_9ACTN|nr:DUF6213 family protein [Kitasatospora phosalacinea]GLW73715.1 hypothetical protein Kpho02_60130 [Kitasatospora phosalacinea]